MKNTFFLFSTYMYSSSLSLPTPRIWKTNESWIDYKAHRSVESCSNALFRFSPVCDVTNRVICITRPRLSENTPLSSDRLTLAANLVRPLRERGVSKVRQALTDGAQQHLKVQAQKQPVLMRAHFSDF